jgi:hypothetical protein
MAKVEPKYQECLDCKHFSSNRVNRLCSKCGAGEFFEERHVVHEPSLDELMEIYSQMESENE